MAAQVQQLPGQLPLSLVKGDYFSMNLNFGGVITDLTGYVHEAQITDSSGGSAIDFKIDPVPSLPLSLCLSLTEEQTLAIPAKAKWHFTWKPSVDGNPRTLVAGPVSAVAK